METEPDRKINSVSGEANRLLSEWFSKYSTTVVPFVVLWTILYWFVVFWWDLMPNDWYRRFLVFLFPLLLFVSVLVERLTTEVRKRFWQMFAKKNNFSYSPKLDITQEAGVMFQVGHHREAKHFVEGQIDERQVRVFNYQFTIGYGRGSKTYAYTVFAFRFAGHFPHLYLNRLGNQYNMVVGKEISLPVEFRKSFRLFTAEEYEIEALQIFTPDLLVDILDSNLRYDVELVNQELMIFVEGWVERLDKLEKEFLKARVLATRFSRVLDKISYARIPGQSPTIKKLKINLRGFRLK